MCGELWPGYGDGPYLLLPLVAVPGNYSRRKRGQFVAVNRRELWSPFSATSRQCGLWSVDEAFKRTFLDFTEKET